MTEGLKDMSGGRLILKKRVIGNMYIFAGEYAKDRMFCVLYSEFVERWWS